MSKTQRPAIRDQLSGMWEQLQFSIDSATNCTGESLTRPELAADTDINTLMQRYAGQPNMRELSYGEYDFTLTLRDAIEAQRASTNSWQKIPREIRQEYGDWDGVINAIEKKEVAYVDGAIRRVKPDDTPKPPTETPKAGTEPK